MGGTPEARPSAQLQGHDGAVQSIAFARDGSILASAGADTTVRLWDLEREEEIGEPLAGHEESVTSVAFSPDGELLASAGQDDTLRLWDVDAHGPAGRFRSPTERRW